METEEIPHKKESNKKDENLTWRQILLRKSKSKNANTPSASRNNNQRNNRAAQNNEKTKQNEESSESSSDSEDEQTNTQPKVPKIPPIIINLKENDNISWNKVNQLCNTNQIHLMEVKILKSGEYKITPTTSTDHRILTTVLGVKNIQYYSYVLPEEKKLKVVIRGVDPNETAEVYLNELKALGFPALSVFKITSTKSGTRKSTPLIMVELEKTDAGKNIYNLTHLCYLRIKVETLRRKSGPGQCHRCQRYGHAACCCNMKYRCVACGEDHQGQKCPHDKKTTPPKCANCSQQHPANYKGCTSFPRLRDKRRRDLPARTEPR